MAISDLATIYDTALPLSTTLTVSREEWVLQILEALRSDDAESRLVDSLGIDNVAHAESILAQRDETLGQWDEVLKTADQKDASLSAQLMEAQAQAQSTSDPQLSGSIGIPIVSSSEQAKERRKAARKASRKAATGKLTIHDEVFHLTRLLALRDYLSARDASKVAQAAFHEKKAATLPEGTLRRDTAEFVEFQVPCVDLVSAKEAQDAIPRIPINSLPKWMQPLFPGIPSLNAVQSHCYEPVFSSSENFILSAPTGAGKTNVALLAICSALSAEMARNQSRYAAPKVADLDSLNSRRYQTQVVYVAPMKALVAEVVEKFTSTLQKHLGLVVAEYTGDMTLTRSELLQTNVIVTVPEKWDALQRSGVRLPGCVGYQTNSRVANDLPNLNLIILDEVHMLNEDRGVSLEAVVSRIHRFNETNERRKVRLCALSATLPNPMDIAAFLRVPASHALVFDKRFRSVPLHEHYVGVKAPIASLKKMCCIGVAYDRTRQQVLQGNQVLIFVHTRGDTAGTLKEFLELDSGLKKVDDLKAEHSKKKGGHGDRKHGDKGRSENKPPAVPHGWVPALVGKQGDPVYDRYLSRFQASKNRNLLALYLRGVGIHHAGLLRADRTLIEDAFRDGALNVVVCTSTLAWGVNLPARCVIILGTSVFDSQVGGQRDISILDILQMFGRAGRPQYDTVGIAHLITSVDKLDGIVRTVCNQAPIESRMATRLEDFLNAEICLGNVSCDVEGAAWLQCTYLQERMTKVPEKYGVHAEEITRDPYLAEHRMTLVRGAVKRLALAGLVTTSKDFSSFAATDLGRVACKLCIEWVTAEMIWKTMTPKAHSAKLLEILANASEFKQLRVREDETNELESISRDSQICPIVSGVNISSVVGKVCVLFQAVVSGCEFEQSSLVSDAIYIFANAGRIIRCMLHVAAIKGKGMADVFFDLLELSKVAERRFWGPYAGQHILIHFTYPPDWNQKFARIRSFGFQAEKARHVHGLLPDWIWSRFRNDTDDVARIRESKSALQELQSIVGAPEPAKTALSYIEKLPYFTLTASLKAAVRSNRVVTLMVTVVKRFSWTSMWSGSEEPFHLIVEDPKTKDVVYYESHYFKESDETVDLPILLSTDSLQENLEVALVSDRWIGLEFRTSIVA